MTVLDEALRQGALGVGVPIGYMTHGVTSYEMFKYQELTSKYDRITNAHTRFAGVLPPLEGALGIQELMSNAMVLNAPLMVAHLNSICDWEFTMEYANMARHNGHKIFGEVYPYHAGSTLASTDILLPEGMKSLGIAYADVYYVDPYERWTEEIYNKRFDNPGKTIVIESNKEEDIVKWMSDPETILCSDAMPCYKDGDVVPWDSSFEGWTIHPRASGTRGKFLKMCRGENSMDVPLMTAIKRMTYLPAKYFFEIGNIPHFRFKDAGRMRC